MYNEDRKNICTPPSSAALIYVYVNDLTRYIQIEDTEA